MPAVALAGHGALYAIELPLTPYDPIAKTGGVPNHGTFTTIAELNATVSGLDLMRAKTESSPHNRKIDSYAFSPLLKRNEWTLSVNYIYGDDTHAALLDYLIRGVTFGVRMRGPDATTPDVDEILASGQLLTFKEENPVREGIRTVSITFQPSGPMYIDGDLIGADA